MAFSVGAPPTTRTDSDEYAYDIPNRSIRKPPIAEMKVLGGMTVTGNFNDVHRPVLLREVVDLLGSEDRFISGGLIVDGTLGAAGHASACLEAFDRAELFGIDQDPEILEIAREKLRPFGERARVTHGRISELSSLLQTAELGQPTGMLFDLGVSSLQLDQPERGFSFAADGPLDMRMDPTRERTAADIINNWDEADLADLFYYEGDESRSRSIARAIVQSRRRAPFLRTSALAELIAGEMGGGKGGKIHPATRCFQALRRAVNEEGEELLSGLDVAEEWLANEGVLVVISFHSGEDRAVKHFFAEGARRGRWRVLTKKPLAADRQESRTNRRARSARVRAAVRVRAAEASAPRGEGAS